MPPRRYDLILVLVLDPVRSNDLPCSLPSECDMAVSCSSNSGHEDDDEDDGQEQSHPSAQPQKTNAAIRRPDRRVGELAEDAAEAGLPLRSKPVLLLAGLLGDLLRGGFLRNLLRCLLRCHDAPPSSCNGVAAQIRIPAL